MSIDQEKMSREELRLLCQRVKLIDTHLDTLCNSKKRALTNGGEVVAPPPPPTPAGGTAGTLPSLCEALALDIPFDLKQRIANSAKSNALLPSRSANSYQFAFALNPVQIPAPPHPSQLMITNTTQNGKKNRLFEKYFISIHQLLKICYFALNSFKLAKSSSNQNSSNNKPNNSASAQSATIMPAAKK